MISFEYMVTIPSLDTVIYMQDGSGDQLLAEDYEQGYDSYVDYEIRSGKNKGDGGLYMYKSADIVSDDWRDAIPEAIKFALDLDTCPKYTLTEVE